MKTFKEMIEFEIPPEEQNFNNELNKAEIKHNVKSFSHVITPHNVEDQDTVTHVSLLIRYKRNEPIYHFTFKAEENSDVLANLAIQAAKNRPDIVGGLIKKIEKNPHIRTTYKIVKEKIDSTPIDLGDISRGIGK